MRGNLRTSNPYSIEELQKLTPSVFATEAHPRMSSKYVFVPTSQVVGDMLSLGWSIGNAFETKARKGIGYQPHCVEFFRPDLVINKGTEEEMYPTVILKNSHNGLSGFEFRIGIYRMVCSNGMVVADQEFGKIFIKHIGYNFGELAETIFNFVTKVESIADKINLFMVTPLTDDQALDFALRASKIRLLDSQSMSITQVKGLLESKRMADRGQSLWKVLNKVQEGIIQGEFTTMTETDKGKKFRKARPIKNFQLDLEYNEKIWQLANEYVAV